MTIHYNMSAEDYHSHEALGSTDISALLDNPRKFYYKKKGLLKQDQKHFILGRALHVFLLERDKFYEQYQVCPERDKRKKAYKEFMENADPNLEVLSLSEFEEIETLTKKALELPKIHEFLEMSNTNTEVSYFVEIDGVPVKCRIDLRVPYNDGVIVFDPKTMAKDLSLKNIEKTMIDYNYHIQEALYSQVMTLNGENILDYLFCCISKQEYSGAVIVKNNQFAIDQAKEDLQKALKKYKYYYEKYGWEKPWPEHEEKVVLLNMPQSGYYKYQDEQW